ncbi:MAG: UDP-glucose 6-dehydrogenase [Chloroflexi bacterium RBG_13_53_26]|nr:MAG: UDP-glucose 6-dehydrogenase [Chloroflexi bacterium RBG_13_53_26]
MSRNISIIGSGHVGLVVAACLARQGNQVTVVDTDEEKVRRVNARVCPIYEPGLQEILSQVNIQATSDYSLISNSEIVFTCVPTPSNTDGSISLGYIKDAIEQVSLTLRDKSDYYVVVVKSTVAPGTTEEVVIPILESSGKKAGIDFGVCMTPEFLREGKGVFDFMNPSRIVIGEHDRRSGDILCSLYRDFTAPVLRVNLKTAEMIKYASNAFLATKVSFINEIGNICKRLGIDTYEVVKGMAYDERIGNKFLNAGIGFGGSCLRKDLAALIAKARQIDYEPSILREVFNLNERQAVKMIDLLKRHISVKDSTVGLLGLSFKPEADNVNGSLAVTVVNALLKEGARLKAYDPQAMANLDGLFPRVECVAEEEVLGCDAILILTEWEEFEHLDYRGKIVIDGRRILKAKEAEIYEGVCW